MAICQALGYASERIVAQLGGVIFLGQPSGTFMHIVSKLLIFSINLQTGYIAG
jgi:hypothetical protein